jgi:predicted dehydrogenase
MTHRRTFLLGTTAALAIATLGPARAASDTLRIACLGTGGRCRHLMKSLVAMKKVQIVALADVWEVSLAEAAKLVPGKVTTFRDYRKAVESKDVDAVLIASPDHWHVPMMVDALAAGKHVYVEKPLTHTLAEGAVALKAAKDFPKLKVQVGMQQRSMPHLIEARELVTAKKLLGDVIKVRMSWNRNTDRIRRFKLGVDPKTVDWKGFLGTAKEQPFDEYRFRNWRWFWDFGGGILTDLMVHWVDVAQWFLDTEPTAAVSVGTHVSSEGVWETPDTVQTLLSYPGRLQMHFEGTFANARDAARIEFLGTEGTLYADRGRFEFHPEPRSKAKPIERILGAGARGRDFYDKPDGEALHLENWLTAIRDDQPTTAPIAAGVASARAAHLANAALRRKD